jgi:hypothetical protein
MGFSFYFYFLLAFGLAFFGSGFILAVPLSNLIYSFLIALAFMLLIGLILSFRKFLIIRQKVQVQSLPLVVPEKIDKNRRLFLKTLGSLGLGGLVYFLFTKKAQAVQFGGTGVPDPIGIEPLGNSQTTGSVTLTDANTWYQVPAGNQASRVFLVLHNRSGYDMYWTFDNTVSASTGGLLFPSGGTLQFDAGNAVNVYVRCGTAAQTCWYAESQSQ